MASRRTELSAKNARISRGVKSCQEISFQRRARSRKLRASSDDCLLNTISKLYVAFIRLIMEEKLEEKESWLNTSMASERASVTTQSMQVMDAAKKWRKVVSRTGAI